MRKAKLQIISILLIGAFFLTGCQWPFSTKAKISNYINRVEPIFNQNRTEIEELGDQLSLDKLDQETAQQNLEIVEEMESRSTADKERTEAIQAITEVDDLKNKLGSFYSIQQESVGQIVGLFRYLAEVESYWNKPAEYAKDFNKIPVNNLNKTAKALNKINKRVEKDLKELRQLETNDFSGEFHRQISTLYRAMEKYSANLYTAVQNKSQSQITSAQAEFEESIEQVADSFDKLDISQDLADYEKNYDQAAEAVQAEISNLKRIHQI